MSTLTDVPTRLTTVTSEQEAAIIVAALAGQGIKANYAGDTTANFRVGVPGKVQVYVSTADLQNAIQKLQALRETTFQELAEDEDSSPNSMPKFLRAVAVIILLLLLLIL